MKLYYAEFLNPRKVCALARHLKSPVDFILVEFAKGGGNSAQFTSLNPNRKVPVLDTGGGAIWESNAIMCYLARAAGCDLWPREDDLVDMVRWLSWNSEHFSRYGGELYFQRIIRPAVGMGAPDTASVEEATRFMRKFGAVLNDHLAGRKYVLGDTLTIVDFAVAATLPYAEKVHLPLDGFTEIERWYARLNELPAWREPFPVRRANA